MGYITEWLRAYAKRRRWRKYQRDWNKWNGWGKP